MRAAHKAQGRGGVWVFPHNGVARLDALELLVVDDVDLRAFLDERLALFLRLGGQTLDVVQAHRAVGGGRRAEVLEVGAGLLVELGAEPAVKPLDVGDLLHDLHADGGAEKLRLGFFFAFDFDDPGGLAALVGQQAELGHKARHRAHELDDAGVAVAPCAEHGVCVHDGGGLGPAQNVALFGLVSHLVEIAGAGVILVLGDAELLELPLVFFLVGVHDFFEYDALQQTGRHRRVDGAGVGGELLPGGEARGDELVIEIIDRLDGLETEGNHRVAAFAGDGDHALGTEGVAVHDEGLDDLGHGFALRAVEHGLLFRCQFQNTTSL